MKKRKSKARNMSLRQWTSCLAYLAVGPLLGIGARGAEVAKPAPKVDLTEVSLEQLMFDYKVKSVYGASKHEQKISEAPSSISIIDSEEIKKYGYRNLADALASARGLTVSYDRNYSYLGVRGFNRPGDYTSRVLVLVDGHRVNENVFDSVLIGNDFPLDIDLVDRIEIIRGPSSSIYGNNAFFGVINIITRKGRDLAGAETSVAYGSFNSFYGRFSYGKSYTNGVEFLASGSFFDSAGQHTLYYPEYNVPGNDINNGIAHHADYERYYKFFSSISYRDFTLAMDFSSRLKGVPTGAYGTIFNDDRFKTTDNRAYIDLKYQHTFKEDWEVIARVSYDNYYYYGDYPIIYPPATDVLYQDYAYGNWWTADVQLNKKIFDRHRLTAGAEFRDNFQQDQGNEDNYVPRTVYNDSRSSYQIGLYGQGEVLILTNLILNAGIRYDHFETFGDTVNPRVGLIYSPFDTSTFKALYGTAFKGPNAYELYYSGPNNKANTGLKPETIETYELVYEQGLTRHLSFIASGFYYKIDDLINQQLDPLDNLLVYRNLDQVTARGVELELDGKFAGGFRGRASYSFQETRDEATDSILSNSPKHLAKFNLIAPLWKEKVFSGFEVQYSSRAKTLAGNYAAGYWVANWTLFSQNIVQNLEFSASLYNVFDKRFYFPGAGEHLQDKIQQDGRTFRLKLTYRF